MPLNLTMFTESGSTRLILCPALRTCQMVDSSLLSCDHVINRARRELIRLHDLHFNILRARWCVNVLQFFKFLIRLNMEF